MIDLSIGIVLRQYVLVVTINLALFQMGLGVAWLSPVLVKLMDEHQDILPKPLEDGNEAAWFMSISSIVGISAITFTSFITNHIGRKYSLLLTAVPRLLMCGFILFANETWMLLVGRSFCGLADFMAVSIAATYASEIASKEIRGGLGTISQILAALGAMIMLTVGPFISYLYLNIMYTCLIVATFIPMLMLPESPYFLFTKGYNDEAIKVLTTLRGSEQLAHEEIKEYNAIETSSITFKELKNDKILLKTLAKVIVLCVGFELTGYNAVALYLQSIYNMTNTSLSSEVSSAITGCIQLIACFCTIIIVDRFGRKPILIASLFGLTVGMIGLGTFFKLSENGQEITGFMNFLPLISIIFVIYFYNAGIGSLQWMFLAELFDGRHRAFGISLSAMIISVLIFLLLRYFPIVTVAIGPASTFWMFSGFCVITCLYIAIYLPETKGKPFSQIQIEMGRKNAQENGERKKQEKCAI